MDSAALPAPTSAPYRAILRASQGFSAEGHEDLRTKNVPHPEENRAGPRRPGRCIAWRVMRGGALWSSETIRAVFKPKHNIRAATFFFEVDIFESWDRCQ